MSAEHDRRTEVLIPHEKIEQRINEVSLEVIQDYKEKNLLLVGILNGCFVTLSTLSQKLWGNNFRNFEVDFVGVSTYDEDDQSTKEPRLTKDLKRKDISDYDVLIVEDIKDKGHTIKFVQDLLEEKNPRSIRTLALLSKKGTEEVKVPVEYVVFEIENVWVEGFGLDSGEYGRGNPDIIRVYLDK
jgi:hypoxanthine phosphoribosyltransferase